MTLKTTYSENLTTLKISNMQSAMVSNRVILGIVAFSVSFGLSLVPNWDFNKAFVTGVITLVATYAAALFIDTRRRSHEMLILGSLRKRIKETEGLKSRVVREINQLEDHRNLLYTESKNLQNQVVEVRNQRDSLHRELGNFSGQKKQLESEITNLTTEIHSLDKNKVDLSNSISHLTTEKRRLETQYNSSRSEITQLQSQLCELQQEKQELENSLTLLGRIKPQLEEKMYELRITIQDLEVEANNLNQLLISTKNEQDNLAVNLNSLKTQKTEVQTELQQLQGETSLLQQERDSLQNQVWDLLQQVETFSQEPFTETVQEEIDLFPFAALLEPLDSATSVSLPQEWDNFLKQLPNHELQVLKAIIQQDNPKTTIKQIAEANITMPNLLIDSINERANDTIGELIIETSLEKPQIYQEHILNIQRLIAMYENLISKHTSSN